MIRKSRIVTGEAVEMCIDDNGRGAGLADPIFEADDRWKRSGSNTKQTSSIEPRHGKLAI
jgi:hypothetical protein